MVSQGALKADLPMAVNAQVSN